MFRLIWMLVGLIWYVFASAQFQQHKYTVIQENMTISDVNTDVVDIRASVYKFNETVNALNLTLKFHIQLPEDTKVFAIAYRWINNEYRFCIVQIQKTIKRALLMEMFDLDSLFLHYAQPPMVWPLEKGVTYRAFGWSPDSTKFPPNLPEGSWKVPITLAFGNKSTIAIATWYLKLKYKK